MMPRDSPRLTVRLTLEHRNLARSAISGLKRLLKVLLRGYGWRCVAIEDLTPQPVQAAETARDGPEPVP